MLGVVLFDAVIITGTLNKIVRGRDESPMLLALLSSSMSFLPHQQWVFGNTDKSPWLGAIDPHSLCESSGCMEGVSDIRPFRKRIGRLGTSPRSHFHPCLGLIAGRKQKSEAE